MRFLWKKYLYGGGGLAILLIAPFITHAALTVVCASQQADSIPNPIGVCSFLELVTSVSKAILTVAIPVATIAIIFVGLRLIIASSSGNEGELKKAKSLLVTILIGTVIVIGALAFATAAVNFAKNLGT